MLKYLYFIIILSNNNSLCHLTIENCSKYHDISGECLECVNKTNCERKSVEKYSDNSSTDSNLLRNLSIVLFVAIVTAAYFLFKN